MKRFLGTILGMSLLAAPVFAADLPASEGIVKVKIETTLGDIEMDLYSKQAPKTVENFVTLAKKGFYDGLLFHRVDPTFMIQGGDPEGNGTGGPGYYFEDEFSELSHDHAGTVSMANTGRRNTNGSQFFITVRATKGLDRKHSVFGYVTKGQDVVGAISLTPAEAESPLTPVVMKKVTVLEA